MTSIDNQVERGSIIVWNYQSLKKAEVKVFHDNRKSESEYSLMQIRELVFFFQNTQGFTGISFI